MTIKRLYDMSPHCMTRSDKMLMRLHQAGMFLKLAYYGLRNWAIIEPPHEWKVMTVAENNNIAFQAIAKIIIIETDPRRLGRLHRSVRFLMGSTEGREEKEQ